MSASTPLPLSAIAALHKARAQFEAQQFWDCHETLEPVWLAAAEPDKTFFQGLIQVAAGFVHIQKRNPKGAQSLLGQGLEKLQRVRHHPAFQAAMALDTFISETQTALNWVTHARTDQWQQETPEPLAHPPRFIVRS